MANVAIILGTFLTVFILTMVILTKIEIGDRKDGSPLFIATILAIGITLIVGGIVA